MEELPLGPKILQLRKKLKLTQVQLADKIGVSGAAISNFEKGTINPAPETVEKLSQALGFDFSTSQVKPKPMKWKGDLPEIKDWLWALIKESQKETSQYKPVSYSINPNYLNSLGGTVGLIMFNQAGFIKSMLESDPNDTNRSLKHEVRVMTLPGIDYQQALVLEVQGSSMAPRYPEGSRYVLFPVYAEHRQYATGVHAIWLKSKKLLIKRIVSNKEGIITLKSDATGDQTSVEVGDIAALWRFGQAIHLPPEEL